MNLGNLKDCELTISEPLKMDKMKMEFNNLMIMVGANGSGKTYILKLSWIVSSHVNMCILAKENSQISFDERTNLTFLFENSFYKAKTTGDYKFTFTSGCSIHFVMEDGLCVKAETTLVPKIKSGAQPLFLSKDARLLETFVKYMKFKKMIGLVQGFPTSEEDLKKVLEMYRIYDIIAMESLMYKITSRTNDTNFNLAVSTLKGMDPALEIKDISVNYNVPDIIITDKDGKDASVLTYSAGQQALMTMIFSNSL